MIPFLVTNPESPLLYLGTDPEKLKNIGKTIQFNSVEDGPAPPHEIITLHRHGHAFGGLPWLFWISLFLLIAIFHIFFCKVVYNELCKNNHTQELPSVWKPQLAVPNLKSQSAISARNFLTTELARKRRTDLDNIP